MYFKARDLLWHASKKRSVCDIFNIQYNSKSFLNGYFVQQKCKCVGGVNEIHAWLMAYYYDRMFDVFNAHTNDS